VKAARIYTPQEYLALERKAAYKSEYIGGFIVAMPGVSRWHDRIAGDTYAALHAQLADGPCEIFTSDIRVKNEVTGRYTDPDASVVCGEPQFADEELDTLLNPTVIIEILSPSTEAYDRGDKFEAYRRLPSLQEYVRIAQNRASVDHFLRQGRQ